MQLPHSETKAAYIGRVRKIEASLKDATSGNKDESLLGQTQEHLDTLAEEYQYNEEIGAARYKLYELQALIHYFNNDDDSALDFINQAIEMRGDNYAKAQKLKDKLLEKPTPDREGKSQEKPILTEAETKIVAVRQSVQSAGLWSAVSGIVLLFVGIIVAAGVTYSSGTIGSVLLITGLAILAASTYSLYSGVILNKCQASEDSIKKLLKINIATSIITVWSVFPAITLITSITALKQLHKLGEPFETAMRKYDKIATRIQQFQNKNSIFFYRSPLVVALLSIVTFNFYSIYWAYKHWSLIGKSINEKTHPILSAIFIIFTIYPLAKRIRDGASSHGYKKFKNAGWAAAGIIILAVLSNSLGKAETTTTDEAFAYIFFGLVLSAGTGAIMATIQKAANTHNLAVLGKNHEFKKAYGGEITMTAIGVIITILAIWASFLPATSSQQTDPRIEALYQRIETLRTEYDSCSSDIDARSDSVDIYNSYEVDSYNSDLAECEDTRLELNSSVDEYNRLAGFEEA